MSVKWSVPPSRKYRLRVAPDGRSAVIEFNNSADLPSITITADSVRQRKKLKR